MTKKENKNCTKVDHQEAEERRDETKPETNTIVKTNDLKQALDSLLKDHEARENNHFMRVKQFDEQQKKEKEETVRWAEDVKAKANKEASRIIKDAEEKHQSMLKVSSKMVANMEQEKEKWEKEKALIAKTQEFGSRIKLDVGGNKFTTSLTTLTRFPESMIGVMFSGRHALQLDEDGYCFIDRDGSHFRHILNFLRDPENFHINLSSDHKAELKVEADYYGLGDEMFPFVPAGEEEIYEDINDYGKRGIICYQSDSGKWYFKVPVSLHNNYYNYRNNAVEEYDVVEVTCCRKCNCGFTKMANNGFLLGVRRFLSANGRKIDDPTQAKPRQNNRCPCCR